jgi:DNA-binding response OmpR family regulator
VKKILIADDSVHIRDLMRATLEADFFLVEAADGEEALAKARKEKPDLALLDVMMPRKTGIEACRQLKADPATKNIPVVMLTALKSSEDIRRGKEVGADAYFTKPFSPRALLDKVNGILEGE